MTARTFDAILFRELREPAFAAAYLQDALNESPEEFFISLREYIQANNGMTQVAKDADMAREA